MPDLTETKKATPMDYIKAYGAKIVTGITAIATLATSCAHNISGIGGPNSSEELADMVYRAGNLGVADEVDGRRISYDLNPLDDDKDLFKGKHSGGQPKLSGIFGLDKVVVADWGPEGPSKEDTLIIRVSNKTEGAIHRFEIIYPLKGKKPEGMPEVGYSGGIWVDGRAYFPSQNEKGFDSNSNREYRRFIKKVVPHARNKLRASSSWKR